MTTLQYLYCRENKNDEAKVFKLPKNENAARHLQMDKKPTVYVIPDQPLDELLQLCAVPVIDPLVLATIFIRHFPETFSCEDPWTSFNQPISRRVNDKNEVGLEDLFQVENTDNFKPEGTPGMYPTLHEVLFLTCMQFRLGNYVSGEYREYLSELKTKMTALGKNPPFKVNRLTNLVRYEEINKNENLQRVIAGVDMYLMRNSTSQ